MSMDSEKALDRALTSLQPFYEEGDDGDMVRKALDAIAAILADKIGIKLNDEEALIEALKAGHAPADLIQEVEKLYQAAEGGEYGAGLSNDGARELNKLIEDIVDSVIDFVRDYKKVRPRPATPRRAQK